MNVSNRKEKIYQLHIFVGLLKTNFSLTSLDEVVKRMKNEEGTAQQKKKLE